MSAYSGDGKFKFRKGVQGQFGGELGLIKKKIF
jgi:hypothetical protein